MQRLAEKGTSNPEYIKNHTVQRLQRHAQASRGKKRMVIMWTPGNGGIQGSVLVDAVAKTEAVGVP